jgi:hypothetical protein
MEDFNVNENINENTNNNDQETISIVEALSDDDRQNLALTAYWAKFLGIVGFVMAGIILLVSFFMIFGMAAMSSISSYGSTPGLGSIVGLYAFIGIIYIVMAIFLFIMAQYQYKAGKSLNMALKNNSDFDLSDGIKNIKSIFRTQGILTAVVLGIYAVIIVLAILGGMAALMMR